MTIAPGIAELLQLSFSVLAAVFLVMVLLNNISEFVTKRFWKD